MRKISTKKTSQSSRELNSAIKELERTANNLGGQNGSRRSRKRSLLAYQLHAAVGDDYVSSRDHIWYIQNSTKSIVDCITLLADQSEIKQPMLLSIIRETTALLNNPSHESAAKYKLFSNQLPGKGSEALKILAGLTVLAGALGSLALMAMGVSTLPCVALLASSILFGAYLLYQGMQKGLSKEVFSLGEQVSEYSNTID